MVPYEAFLSEKPVLTTTDAGGPLEIVADRRTGLVDRARRRRARACGRAPARAPGRGAGAAGAPGDELAARVTWDGCIERLLA